MTMFTPLSQRIVDRLAEADVDGLTPREALNLLAELQRELKGGDWRRAWCGGGDEWDFGGWSGCGAVSDLTIAGRRTERRR